MRGERSRTCRRRPSRERSQAREAKPTCIWAGRSNSKVRKNKPWRRFNQQSSTFRKPWAKIIRSRAKLESWRQLSLASDVSPELSRGAVAFRLCFSISRVETIGPGATNLWSAGIKCEQADIVKLNG